MEFFKQHFQSRFLGLNFESSQARVFVWFFTFIFLFYKMLFMNRLKFSCSRIFLFGVFKPEKSMIFCKIHSRRDCEQLAAKDSNLLSKLTSKNFILGDERNRIWRYESYKEGQVLVRVVFPGCFPSHPCSISVPSRVNHKRIYKGSSLHLSFFYLFCGRVWQSTLICECQ